MECEQVRKELNIPTTPECCESCHEDFENGYGDDLTFEINGVHRFICCSLRRFIGESNDKA